MGKSQKAKGEAGEREAAGLLTDLLGVVVKRKLGQARDGGTDVRVGNCLVEVKRQERARLQMWMKQAEDAAESGELVAVMWRPSRKRWLVCMPLQDWATLMRESLDDPEPEPERDERQTDLLEDSPPVSAWVDAGGEMVRRGNGAKP